MTTLRHSGEGPISAERHPSSEVHTLERPLVSICCHNNPHAQVTIVPTSREWQIFGNLKRNLPVSTRPVAVDRDASENKRGRAGRCHKRLKMLPWPAIFRQLWAMGRHLEFGLPRDSVPTHPLLIELFELRPLLLLLSAFCAEKTALPSRIRG